MRDFEFPGRSTVHATNGMTATSHPLATGAAVDVLKAGGNALDAAIAAAAVLAVVEPQSTGIGGDCFALLCPNGSDQVIAFNGSGRAPAAATVEYYLERGFGEIGEASVHSVTLPGVIDAWDTLHRDHGRMDFGRLLAPAIGYARDGYPVHARVRFDWLSAIDLLSGNAAARALFLPNGEIPDEGDRHRQPLLANSLEIIAKEGRKGFYEGPMAEEMVRTLKSLGGLHRLEDFAAAKGEYVTSIRTNYRGYDVHQVPPNNQGLTVLLMLNLLEGFDLTRLGALSVERTHLEIEAGRLAFEARDSFFADAMAMPVAIEGLLSEEWAKERRERISFEHAMTAIPGLDLSYSDTVYVCVVDRDLNAVSFINSLYDSFGCGILCPKTGVLFHNRGKAFRLDPDHPNCIAPRKRPLHTIMPGMATHDGRVVMAYGVMGGDYQPFGHCRVLANMIDFEMDPQQAVDLPRIFAHGDHVEVEKSLPSATVQGLLALGHKLTLAPEPLGGGQIIRIDHERGILSAGSDPRKDGCALGY